MLSRRSKINLAMSAVVLLLALGVYLTPGTDVGGKSVPLTGIEPADVVRIRIANREGGNVELERQEAGWVLTSPYRMKADAARISGLLRIATTPICSWPRKTGIWAPTALSLQSAPSS